MAWLRVTSEIVEIAWSNRYWMTWNTLLAIVPAALAVLVFRADPLRGPVHWLGIGTFLLFLPNAPYVVTDLLHLRGDVVSAPNDLVVVAGVLPLYGAFVAVGFACYGFALAEVGGWLRRTGRTRVVGTTELGLHLLCAVGVLLGRVARLNSWDTVTQPNGTIERAFATLTWKGSPVAIGLLFVTIWMGHAVARSLARTARAWIDEHPGLAARLS
jgi:uncharacterized membrane protein